MGNKSEAGDVKNTEYYIYNNKKNNKTLPLLHAAGDGIYITLVIYIIYWVIKTYNIIPGLPDIFWLLWIAIFFIIFLVSFLSRYFINKLN